MLNVNIELDYEGYADLKGGYVSVEKLKKCNYEAIADTGASICCAPVSEINCFGLTWKQVMKSFLQLYAADGRKLNIVGCIPVKIAAQMESGWVVAKDLLYFVKGLES